MPIPLGALIINVGILFLLIGKFGGPAIRAGLVSRKERIAGEILSASKMKKEAEQQLAHYEGKLEEMGAELERIKNQMREQAEADRERLVREAKEQRAVLEAEARYLIAQELAHARNEAILKAVSVAAAAARERIVSAIGPQDHERLAGDLRVALKSHLIGQNNATHREQS
jgi:F0F1-type ATP synthase membrane subunit b/b'